MALRSKSSSAVAANDRLALLSHEAAGHGLADRVPELALEAQRIASTVAHGVHGRKRSGPGENFWQFRQLQIGDPTHLIDWRRSASSDHLFIREREWETALRHVAGPAGHVFRPGDAETAARGARCPTVLRT